MLHSILKLSDMEMDHSPTSWNNGQKSTNVSREMGVKPRKLCGINLIKLYIECKELPLFDSNEINVGWGVSPLYFVLFLLF